MQEERKHKVLIVSANEVTTQQFNQLKHFFPSQKVTLSITDNDKYIAGDVVSRFEIALLANFDTDMTDDDFEMQADFFDYYMNAPISAYVTTVSERCSAKLPNELKQKVRKCYEGDYTSDRSQDAVEWLGKITDQLVGYLSDEIFKKVIPAFKKFDKDGSGAIDLAEFKAMTSELGQELDDDQVEAAVTDLDLNGDRLIDLDEFAQWYFSGMKAYSSTQRSFLKFKKGLASFTGSFGGNLFKQDPRTITHHQRVTFNRPTAPQFVIDGCFTLVGKQHDEMLAQASAFQSEKGVDNTEGNIAFYMKIQVASSEEAWAAAEPVYNKFMQGNNMKYTLQWRCGHIDIQYADGNITLRYMEYFPRDRGDLRHFELPEEVVDALKTVDTTVKVCAELATSPAEILSNECPMVDSAFKGFDIDVTATYMRKMAKLLQTFPPLREHMMFMGFALGISSDVSLELDYSDMDELKQHPMAGQLINLTFDDALGMTVGLDRNEVEKFKIPLTDVHEEIYKNEKHRFHAAVEAVKGIDVLNQVLEALDCRGSTVNFECVRENLFTASASIKAPGIGKALTLFMNGFLLKEDVASFLAQAEL